jgi:hypothetical protein
MVRHAWMGHEVVGVEELFFMDLAPGLAPVIGIIDLILRQGESYVVVDHKTSKRFNDPDPGQLVLYAECVRRAHAGADCAGAFDEYRLVPNLKRIRTPAFRRTVVAVTPASLVGLVERYRRAWGKILRLCTESDAVAGDECWFCRPRYSSWG